MSDVIQLLPDHVANQIAAGEVVQRPASVVKELLENAIDAKATRINLLIKDAGKTLIQVSDNGVGMSNTDTRLSFERHATSKIKAADDLFQLKTKGFRGEALASIAAISHINLKSKREEDNIGTEINLKGSKVTSQDPAVVNEGTIVSVKNLFFNIPARRNFLKSDAVEMRHIIDEFQRVALAHPHINFSLHHNGSELFKLPETNLRRRIVNVFGTKANEKIVPVQEDTEIIKVSGFIGKPQFSRKTKGQQFFFVNNRFIKSGYLHHAVKSAYEGLLEDKKHPTYFLYFEIDPQHIDINIHPTKTEIKFDDEHAIYEILKSVVKHSLGQFDVAPSLDFKHNPKFDTPYNYKDKPPEIPKIEVDRNYNPFESEPQTKSKFTHFPQKKNQQHWEALYTGLETDQQTDNIEFESDIVSGKLFSKDEEKTQTGLFQLQNKFIVSSLKGGMLVIHQHRAHYRVLYEEFLKNITVKSTLSQQLLFPLVIHLSTPEIKLLYEIKELLEQAGFDFAEITNEEVKISGIPSMISESEVESILDAVLADLADGVPKEEIQKNSSILAQTLAKNMAIKSGIVLEPGEQASLINRLFACKESGVTPENKNIFIRIQADDLDKKFI